MEYTYKVINGINGIPMCINRSDGASIPFASANTDYSKFKKDLADGAELRDSEGNVMTREQVLEFFHTLP